MALSDLAVFSEYTYSSMTEVLNQQVDLFNGASEGAIVLSAMGVQGDFSETAVWQKVSGLVRRRNAYGSGAVTAKDLAHIKDIMVKVAAGTPPINIDPGMFAWIMKSPEEAGAVIGQQLAKDYLADMLSVGTSSCVAALVNEGTNVYDVSANTAPDNALSFVHMNTAKAKMGDASGEITAWIAHSAPMHALYGQNLTNANNLFVYGNINVMRDPFGKLLIMADVPELFSTTYKTLGLTSGAIIVDQNNDFFANEETSNGDENIKRTYQAEWSYNVGIKGFAWDTTNGGKSPNNSALATGTNWDKYVTSNKDLAGVVLISD